MAYRNIRLHPVLRLIYFLLRVYAWVSTRVFYRRRTILGTENLRFDGPAIVVCNHPSTLMDVLNAGIPIRQEMFFLANYSLFKNPVSNWLLTRLYCIPVKRREDVAEGENRNNDAAFEASYQHLEAYGVLFIAAEGVSWMNRWVRPFKTGAARIAFGAENRNLWELGVKVIPVGVSYSAANLFRSELVVNFGAPVPVREWEIPWKWNADQAAEDFTAQLEQKVRDLTIDTRDEAGERAIGHWEEMFQNAEPLDGEGAFLRSRKLVAEHLDDTALIEKTEMYFSRLQALGLRDAGFQMAQTGVKAGQIAMLLLGFPFFVAGWLFWFLPCYLPGLLARKLKLYIGYDSNVKTLAGSLTFALALLWAPWLAGAHDQWAAGAVMLCCIGLGYFTEQYLDLLGRWKAYRRFGSIPKEEQSMLQVLRQEILESIR
jgi:1-acyl-sn-glycerol-3-phosphate acyltransferase